MPDRQWLAEGVQVYEEGEKEYMVEGIQITEDQVAAPPAEFTSRNIIVGGGVI